MDPPEAKMVIIKAFLWGVSAPAKLTAEGWKAPDPRQVAIKKIRSIQ